MGDEHRPRRRALLQRNRIIFNVTSNPDGRVANTRANAAGYDLNRDLTIASQPESRLIRDLIVETKPIITLDLHGYVNPTLLQPSTPPHNVNNEYDLYIKHGLPNALNIEQGLRRPRLPRGHARADPVPRRRAGRVGRLPADLRAVVRDAAEQHPVHDRGAAEPARREPARRPRRRADIDTDVHEVAIKTSLKYIQDNRNQVIFDQAEVYRRGWAGEPLRDIPDGFVPGWGPEDKYTHDVPARVRDPGRRAPALRTRRQAAGRPADRQRRPRHPGQGRVHCRRQVYPAGLATSSTCTSPSAAS